MCIYRRVAVTSIIGFDSGADSASPISVVTDFSPRSGSIDSDDSQASLSSLFDSTRSSSVSLDSPMQLSQGPVQIRTISVQDFTITNCDALLERPLTWESGGKGADIESMALDVAIQKINSTNKAEQVLGIKALRGRDSKYDQTQGYILLPHLREMQRAVGEMKEALASCDAVFGIDRGGGMLVSYLKAIENETSTQHLERIPKPKGDVRSALSSTIKATLDRFLSSLPPNTPVKIGFVETFISGSSVNTLMAALAPLKRDTIEFQIVALRQTQGVLKPCKMDKTVALQQVSVPYLLAEDVGYQLTETAVGCNPVVLVSTDAMHTSATALIPHQGVLARDLMVALVSGRLNAELAV